MSDYLRRFGAVPNPLSWVRVALDEHYRAAARGMMAIAGAATFAGVDSDDSRRTAAGRGLDLDDIALREQRAGRTPRLTDTRERARLHHLSEAEACQVVAESCFTPRDEFWVRPWLIPRQRADDLLQRQANSAVQHVTATVPCVEVSFGVRNPITELVHALEKAIGGIRVRPSDVLRRNGLPVEAVAEDLRHGYGNGIPLLTLRDRLASQESFGVAFGDDVLLGGHDLAAMRDIAVNGADAVIAA